MAIGKWKQNGERFLTIKVFLIEKEFCNKKMLSYKRQIIVEEGDFLVFACTEGKSFINLEQAIHKYSKEGKYKISFRPIARDSKMEFTVGVYENPTVGYLRVTYVPKYCQYTISGDSYGEGVVAVVEDYFDVVGLEPIISKDIKVFAKKMKQGLTMEEKRLRGIPNENIRKQSYLGFLRLAQIVRYPKP